jgi:hypothetical protein
MSVLIQSNPDYRHPRLVTNSGAISGFVLFSHLLPRLPVLHLCDVLASKFLYPFLAYSTLATRPAHRSHLRSFSLHTVNCRMRYVYFVVGFMHLRDVA